MVKVTNGLSVFALKADGFSKFWRPARGVDRGPVGADTAKSKDTASSLDLIAGKILGVDQPLQDYQERVLSSGFSTPRLSGNIPIRSNNRSSITGRCQRHGLPTVSRIYSTADLYSERGGAGGVECGRYGRSRHAGLAHQRKSAGADSIYSERQHAARCPRG